MQPNLVLITPNILQGFLTCQCVLGRDVGFYPDAIDAFHHKQDIHTFLAMEEVEEKGEGAEIRDSSGNRFLSSSNIVVQVFTHSFIKKKKVKFKWYPLRF